MKISILVMITFFISLFIFLENEENDSKNQELVHYRDVYNNSSYYNIRIVFCTGDSIITKVEDNKRPSNEDIGRVSKTHISIYRSLDKEYLNVCDIKVID